MIQMVPRSVLKRVSRQLFARGSAIEIWRQDERELYLKRHYLERRNGQGGHLLHQFHSSDPDDPHCHPWDNRTIILNGAYYEDEFELKPLWAVPEGQPNGKPVLVAIPVLVNTRLCKPGYVSPWRPAERIHRVRLIDGQPVWTLFSYGQRRRQWGFHHKDGTFTPGEDSSKARSGGTLEGRWFPRITQGTRDAMTQIQDDWAKG